MILKDLGFSMEVEKGEMKGKGLYIRMERGVGTKVDLDRLIFSEMPLV